MQHRLLLNTAILFFLFFMPAIFAPQSIAEGAHILNDSAADLMRRGEYEKALEKLQDSFSLFPYDESIRKNLIAAYASVGKQQLDRKQFDEAAKNFENARKLAPDNQEYGILKGIALYWGKHYDESAIELENARQNGGENVLLLYYLGKSYYDAGDLTRALDAWDRALLLDPDIKAVRDMAAKARRESPVEARMTKGYSSMFVISYDEGTRSDLADDVLNALETAYNRVGSDFSYYPVTRVPVILYTKRDYRSVTAGPEWSGGLYDGKVRLPIGGAAKITPMLRGVLSHEYTHVVVGELTKGNCPAWLNEGLAEMEGRKEYNPPLTELEKTARANSYIPFATLEKTLASLDTQRAALAYQQSYSLVNFMISAYGMYKLRDILVNLGRGLDSNAAITGAFADYGLDFKGIEQEWRAYMKKEYGS